jgi:hypothetical protein
MKKTSDKKKKSKIIPQRWFLDCDEDGRTYLIPAHERMAWDKWIELPWSPSKPDSIPSFAMPIEEDFSLITFTDPIQDER